MMTYYETKAALAKVTYKPGWKFAIVDHGVNSFALAISFEQIDTYNPDRTIKVGFHEPIYRGALVSIEAFQHWIITLIDKIERHEAREWFRYDGVMIFDPHKART